MVVTIHLYLIPKSVKLYTIFLHLGSILAKFFWGFTFKPLGGAYSAPLAVGTLVTKFLQITSEKIIWTLLSGFPIVGVGGGHGGCSILWSFLTSIPIKADISHGAPPLKNEALQLKTKPSTCVSLIKQHWKKMAEIPQKFLTWSIQNFIRKVKQFFRKHIY